MKRKLIIAMIITLFLASVTTGVFATPGYPTGYYLEDSGTGFAEPSSEQYLSYLCSVKMGTIVGNDRGAIVFSGGPTLSEIDALSYWTYTVKAGTYKQLTAWVAIYLHKDPGKTIDDWFADYYGGSPDVYYIQAEPYYPYSDYHGVPDISATLDMWVKWDAFDPTIPLTWIGLETTGSPHGAPTLADYIAGAIPNYSSREYGSLYISAIKIRVGYGGPWVDTLCYVDDVTIADYFEDFGLLILEDLKNEISELSDDDLKNPAANRKVTLSDKIDDVIAKVNAEDYRSAIRKLLKDIRPKLDIDDKRTWLEVGHSELLDKIDAAVEILEDLL